MHDKRYLRLYDLKQKIHNHPEIGTYISEEDIDLMERVIIDETHVRHGSWKPLVYEIGMKCSECGKKVFCGESIVSEEYRYCPHCGARMDGGKSQ